jgi:hypothetical protein
VSANPLLCLLLILSNIHSFFLPDHCQEITPLSLCISRYLFLFSLPPFIMANVDEDEDESYLLGSQCYGKSDPTDDGEWTPITNFPVEISIDDVDTYLLDVALRKVATVKHLFMQRAYGAYQGQRKPPVWTKTIV